MYAPTQWGYYEIFTYGWGKFFHSGLWSFLAIWSIRGRDWASINSKWSNRYTNLELSRNLDCSYIHNCRNWIRTFSSSFTSMDPLRIWRSAIRSTNYYLYNKIEWIDIFLFYQFLYLSKLYGHVEKIKKRTVIPTPTRTKTSLLPKKRFFQTFFVKITIKVKQGQKQLISLN